MDTRAWVGGDQSSRNTVGDCGVGELHSLCRLVHAGQRGDCGEKTTLEKEEPFR